MEENNTRYPLSVIIPIHRSDVDVRSCLNSLLDNPILKLQIVVAANSDSSEELNKINALIPNLPCLTVLNINKAGKSNAINVALHYAKHQYVLIGDADTMFVPNGLNRCVKRIYEDDSIIAITGIVDPIEDTMVTSIQKFEYRRVFTVFRPFWSKINANLIVSGCAGIFKKEFLFKVGLYDCHTLGEDYEITLRLHTYCIEHRIPYKIAYVNAPIARTTVPPTLSSLIIQRGRWFTGQIEVMWKYRKILLHPIRYRRIIVPFIASLLFEVLACFSKWFSLGIILYVSYYCGSYFIKNLLLTELCFVLVECLFNVCAWRRLNVNETLWIIGLTLPLLAIQFVLKDTNLLCAFRMVRKKRNCWH